MFYYNNEYRERNGCPELATGCIVQNATHSGTVFPSATPCSCCKVCLEHLHKGDFCSIGMPGSPVPTSYCGPGLKCQLGVNDEHPRCYPMDDTKCFKEQLEFDVNMNIGMVGHRMQRPSCNENGLFSPIKCIPGQICYCVDENGARIFGEDAHTTLTEITMKCACSRLAEKARKMFDTSKFPVLTSRCLDDGAFDQLQCMGEDCVCVQRYFGTLEEDSTRYDLKAGLNRISCYNKALHGSSKQYLHSCEASQLSAQMEIVEHETDGFNVLGFHIEPCNPNGWWPSVRRNDTTVFCGDKFGLPIKNYSAQLGSEEAKHMNCHCARAKQIAPNTPQCCSNGNYPKFTCEAGDCFCLDENGQQTSVEVDEQQIHRLSCFNNGEMC